MNSNIIKKRIERLSNQFIEVRENFAKLKPELVKLDYNPLSLVLLEEIQYMIDEFLRQNNLNIHIQTVIYEKNIVFIGTTLTDELVWEAIVQEETCEIVICNLLHIS